jgi:PEGA domain
MVRLGRLGGRRGSSALLGFAILAGVGLTGCVERRYTIRTNPPGALVVVNNEEIGTTPVSKTFYYYGDRDITLMRDGFQTERVLQKVDPPWYDNLVTEFISETVIPFTIRDERDFNFQLRPTETPQTDALVDRGQALRTQAQTIPPPRRRGILGFFGF